MITEPPKIRNLWVLIFISIPLLKFVPLMESLDSLTDCAIAWGIVQSNTLKLSLLWVIWLILENATPDLTFKPFLLQIPIQSHSPIKYHPKFSPPWSPEMAWKPTTSAHIFHFPFLTSIQWAVIPKKEAFVLLADHPSAVIEIFPRAAWCYWWVLFWLISVLILTIMSFFSSFNQCTNQLWM